MPAKKARRRDPQILITARIAASREMRNAIYGGETPSDSGAQDVAWAYVIENFCSRKPYFTWDEIKDAPAIYVRERGGPEKYQGPVFDFGVLKRFRAHLWARVKAEGRVEKARALLANPVGLDGSVRVAVLAAQDAEERAAKA